MLLFKKLENKKALIYSIFMIISLLLFSSLSYGKLWVIGDDYVAISDKKSISPKKLTALFWRFDKNNCGIWFTDSYNNLYYIDEKLSLQKKDSNCERIISDIDDFFYTINNKNLLIKRSKDGTPIKSNFVNWLKTVSLINPFITTAFHYESETNIFSLAKYDDNYEETKKNVLIKENILWQNPKVLFSKNYEFWLGYTAKINEFSYTPVIEKRNVSGDILKKFYFNSKGVFFDFCEDISGNLIFSRDIASSSGYTVPVTSVIQKITPSFNIETIYEAETNFLIDSIACDTKNIIFSERSIFSTSDSKLVFEENKHIKLPNKTKAIYICQ